VCVCGLLQRADCITMVESSYDDGAVRIIHRCSDGTWDATAAIAVEPSASATKISTARWSDDGRFGVIAGGIGHSIQVGVPALLTVDRAL
jgi:hypothetical protein